MFKDLIWDQSDKPEREKTKMDGKNLNVDFVYQALSISCKNEIKSLITFTRTQNFIISNKKARKTSWHDQESNTKKIFWPRKSQICQTSINDDLFLKILFSSLKFLWIK